MKCEWQNLKKLKWNKKNTKRENCKIYKMIWKIIKNYKMKIEILKITCNMIILYQNAHPPKKTLIELKVNEDNSEEDRFNKIIVRNF